jgi:hypothetical protein
MVTKRELGVALAVTLPDPSAVGIPMDQVMIEVLESDE